MAEIKNTSGAIIAILVGNPESPDHVQILQHGETFVSTHPTLTIVDESYPGVRDRRDGAQSFAGRRLADPRTDKRFGVRAGAGAASAAAIGQLDATKDSAAGAKTQDGTDVPKNSVGEQTAASRSESTLARDRGR